MKSILIIILLLYANLSFTQNKNQEKDKIFADSISNFIKIINEQENKIKELSDEVNSFKATVTEYSTAKNYFFAIFSGVVAGIGIVMTLIVILLNNSFSKNFRREIDGKTLIMEEKFKGMINDQKNKFDEFKDLAEKEIDKGKKQQLIASKNIAKSMVYINCNYENYNVAFKWAIKALEACRELDDYKQVLICVNVCKDSLDEIIKINKDKEYLKERDDIINEQLHKILELNDEKIEKLDEIKKKAKDLYEKFNKFIWSDDESKIK